MFRRLSALAAAVAIAAIPSRSLAQDAPNVLPTTEVLGERDAAGTVPLKEKYQLPQNAESITAKRIDETINLKDPEDAVKYMPSLFVRKRNDGDNQAVLATRSWGLNSSARTLIYADDLLISALIGNNNSGASPHWNLVSPEAIQRVDFLNGPYSAMYPGNSIGGVLQITTKMPDKPQATAKETLSVQPFKQYGTGDTYVTSQTAASAGSREGAFSWLISAHYLDGYAQPLTYTTSGGIPAGTVGTFPAFDKQGRIANVVGTGALIHTQQTVGNIKLAYDFLPQVRGTYAFGVWNNVQNSNPQTYLTTPAGAPTFGAVATFANNKYNWEQTHVSNAVALKSDTGGTFDFDISASSYNYLQDILINPFTVTPTGAGYSTNGKITRNDGTNWQNVDARGIWRPDAFGHAHEVSFGIHGDRYRFENPLYLSSVWNATSWTGNGQLFLRGVGETRTGALWLQDAWKITPNLKLTLGGRLETWRALDGVNVGSNVATGTGTPAVPIPNYTLTTTNQPGLSSTNFSPKVSLSYDPTESWNITANFGESYRYPTVTELYQNITVNNVAVFPNPNLVPEHDLSGEFNIVRKWNDGRIRLTFFHEHVDNAIISQTNTVTVSGVQQMATTISNVAAIRMQGIELAADKDNVLIERLQLFGSVTYVDSRILSDPTWAGVNVLTNLPTVATGKRVPNVPDWKVTAGYTYRPNDNWAWTVAARYSGKQYSTLDNTDFVTHVYGAFDHYFVVDTKVHFKATDNFAFDVGIDNLFNQQYFLFHPFPSRTYVVAAKYTF